MLRITFVEPHGAKFEFTVLDDAKRPAMTIIFDTEDRAIEGHEFFKRIRREGADFKFPAKKR